MLGLASCQTEPEGLDVNVGGAVDTTITVSIPETETRAGGTNSALSVFENGILDAEDVTMRYIFQVFYKGEASKATPQVAYSDGKSVNFDVRLVPGRDYTFVVWADVVNNANPVNGDRINDDWHYNTSDLTNITINPTTWVAMDESRDAFTVSKVVRDYNGAKTIELKLKRPFAKLRVKTTDMKALNDLVITPKTATVAYAGELYSAFNAYASEVTGDKMEKEHTNFAIASYGDNKANESMILFTDYLFAKSEAEVVNFTLNVFDQNGESIKINNFNTAIPAQRNYLTTISGNVLTDGNNVKVDVQDAFENAGNLEDEPYYVEIWDGKTIKVPAQNEAGNYVIERGSELAWLAAAVSGTLETRAVAADSFAGKTFVLNADIDLGGNEWKPIGMGGKHFEGIFDGQGHTIKGLQVTERYYKSADKVYEQAALFCSLAGNAQIKNLVIDEAYVKYPADSKDYYASAIAGTIYGSNTFENITVKNSTITGNNKVGAIFAHDGSATQITINNCHVDSCYIASEDTADGGNVGGLIGLFQTGSNKVSSINNSSVKNSTIVGINSTNSGKRANSQFIGGISTKANTNLVLKNCVVEDNEFSQTFKGTDVTYVGAFDANFIGGDRNEQRLGVVVINGTRYEGDNEPKNVTAEDGKWYATISEAIAAGNEEITLGDGTFEMPGNLKGGAVIEGNGEGTVLDMDAIFSSYNNVTFRNLTINAGTAGWKGLQHSSNIVYDNCTINGQYFLYTKSLFKDCTFNIEGDAYNIWTWSANEIAFDGCTFNCDGKAVLIYHESDGSIVDFTNCTFNSNDKKFDGKAAIEIDGTLSKDDAKHIVRINNYEVNGFDAGNVSGNNLYNVKKGNKADVFVDNVQVWAAGYTQVANYPNIFSKDGNYYVFSVAGLQDLNNYFKANSIANILWNREYNIAADIDATGFAWDGVRVVVGNNGNNGIVLNGNNHTISNLTINNGALLSGTPCGSNEGVNPGLVKDITMKNVVVNGTTHDASVFWGECYTNVNFENVTVDGAKINGGSNVGALVSRTVIDTPNKSIKVNFKDCVVKKSTLEANSTVADPTGASGFIGRAYGNTQLSFENCSVDNNTINNAEGLVGGAVYGYGVWANGGWAGLGACDTFTDWSGIVFAATIKGERCTLAEAVAKAEAGDTITLVEDVTLTEELGLPAGIIFNGNGKQINGTIYACGDLTFAGHTKVTAFSASYYDRVITIGEGACLEVTGGDRVSLAYGNTFNITGSVDNAKTADKANIQPSLIIPGGISITGDNDATMNVTNAYISLGNTSSKNSSANGKFTLNFTNSIIECTNQFTLSEPTGGKNPEFEMNIKNSVFTTAAKLCVAAANSKITVDNSVVTLGTYLRNSGVIELMNDSVMTGKTIQFGENGGNNGTINVDASTLTITAGNTASAFDGKGIGEINATNDATVSVDYYKGMTINVDATSTFTGVEVQ